MAPPPPQYDVTPLQKEILEKRAQRRLELRKIFQKEATNPFKMASGEAGFVFDAAMMRYNALRVNAYKYFKPTPKTGLNLFWALAPMGIYMYMLKTRRDEKEKRYRNGEVAYKDRQWKFI